VLRNGKSVFARKRLVLFEMIFIGFDYGQEFLTIYPRSNPEVSMIVYHGSNVIVARPRLVHQNRTLDFGYGFYTTTNLNHAISFADKVTSRRQSGSPCVSSYVVPDIEKLAGRYKVLVFSEPNEEWLDFVAACRSGQAHDYDIVEGPMADDTIFNYVQNFIDKKISREAFWSLAKFKRPTHQISFHTAKALTTLRFLKGREVRDEE